MLVKTMDSLLGSNKMSATWHLTELPTAGIMLRAFFKREGKTSFCFTYTLCFEFPSSFIFPSLIND